jgi:RNase P/RNase MRP subunit p30
VDVICLDTTSSSGGLTLNRASSSSTHLEINISTLTETQRPPEHFQIARIKKEIAKAKQNRLPIVISSGADNPIYLRAPRDIAAVGMLLGLDKEEAIGSISSVPISLVNKNRVKLSSRYPEENARIIGTRDE